MKYSELLLQYLNLTPNLVESIKIVIFDLQKDIRVFAIVKNNNTLFSKGIFLKGFDITGHAISDSVRLEEIFISSNPKILYTSLEKLDDVLNKIQLLL